MRCDRRLLLSSLLLAPWAILSGCKKRGNSEQSQATQASASPASGPIVIGHYASMTGSTAHFGQDTDKAVRLAIEATNAKGGPLGRPIQLVTLDTRGDSAEAANAVSRLIDLEKAVAVIGEVASSLSLAGGRVAQRRKIPMVSPSSTNPKVTQIGDQIFRVCFLDPFQGKVMATFARKTLGLERVAILKDIKNDYSIGLAEAFQKAFGEFEGTIALEQSYSQGDTDFSAQLTAIKGSNAQAIFVPGYYSEVGTIARTAERLGIEVPLLGGDGWDAPDLTKIAGSALNGSYFSNHFAPDAASPKAQQFVAAFKARYGQEPSGLGALGYDAAAVLVSAIERAGSATPKAIRDALAQTRNFQGVTGTITIDSEGNAQKSAVVLKIVDGKYKYQTTVEP